MRVTGGWQVEVLSELDQEIANASMKLNADLIQRQALHAASITLTGLCLPNFQNRCAAPAEKEDGTPPIFFLQIFFWGFFKKKLGFFL